MNMRLVSLSFVIFLLSLPTLFLPPSFTLSPLVAQTFSHETRKAEADQRLDAGIELYDDFQLGKALVSFEEALLMYQDINDQVGVGTSLQKIGLVYQSMTEYHKALDYYQRALVIQRDIRDQASARLTLFQIGKIYDRFGEEQQALDYYQQAATIPITPDVGEGKQESSACRDRSWQGVAFNAIGRLYQTEENYSQALDSYQQALTIRGEISDCGDESLSLFRNKGATLLFNTGLVSYHLGQYQQALDYFQQALAIFQELDELESQWATLNRMGVVYRQLGEYQQALNFFQQAQRLNLPMGGFHHAGHIHNLGIVYHKLGEYEQAIDYYQQALASSQGLGNQEGITLNNFGTLYHELKDYQPALDYYQKARAIFQNEDNLKGEGVTLNNLAALYHDLGKIDNALPYYQQALAIFRELGAKDWVILTFNNIKLTRIKSDQTLDYDLENGDRLTKKTPNSPVTLTLDPLLYKAPLPVKREVRLYQEGRQLSQKSDYQEALEKFQQVLVIHQENGNKAEEGTTLNQIGLVYSNVGEYAKALDFYQQALAIPEQVVGNTGAIHYNIGQVYSQLGDYNQALDFYQQASVLAQERSYKAGEVRILNTIGNVHSQLGQYKLALEFYQQALAVLNTVAFDKKLLEGATLNNIGQVYRHQGNYELALDLYQQALAIQKQLGSQGGESVILDNMGEAYVQLGKYKTALAYYQQALTISQDIGERANSGETLSNIGYLLEKQNQPELAIIFFKQSVNLREAIRESIKGLPQDQQQSYTETITEDYRHLADLLLQQNRILEAQRVLDLLKVQELDDYFRNVRGNEETAQGVPNLPPEQQIEEGYQRILEQAISLGQELSQLRQKNNLTPQDEQRITQLVNAQAQIIDDFDTFIYSEDVLALVDQLSPRTRTPDLVDELDKLLGLPENLRNLPQNAVLFYPLILEDRLELILTTPDSPPIRRTVSVTKAQLNQTIVDFRRALKNPTLNAKIPAQKLYNWLIKPLENDLTTAAAETIIYAADGQLRYIPLAALHDGKQWLVQRYSINNITAFSLTNLNRKPQPKIKLLAAAFANGFYNVNVAGQRFQLGGLPYAGVEVETLAKTVPGTTTLFDAAFNPEETIPKLGNYTVIHFATHGAFVVGTPEESFILFGDGTPLTVSQMRTLNLNGVDLVVLSACETGVDYQLGTGAEILGLGYQLERAGARAAIASLWVVDDGGTQRLMNAFYSVWQSDNLTKVEALRQAQLVLITGDDKAMGTQGADTGMSGIEAVSNTITPEGFNRFSHPYYWAPFILIGNGL